MKTGSQSTGMLHVFVGISGAGLAVPPQLPASFQTYRTIRKHPTVALARRLSIAPILRASWGIEGDISDTTRAIVEDLIDRHRSRFLSHSLRNLYDYGFAAFEQYLNEEQKLVLKPLLVDYVNVRSDAFGEFGGLEVGGINSAAKVSLDPVECVFLGFEAEAGNFFGEGLLENARLSFNEWTACNAGATRYDAKIAGTQLQLHFPSGKSTVDGVEKDNYEVAQDALDSFESSGSVAFEEGGPAALDDLGKLLPPRWNIEYVSDASSKQASFIERMKYLDALMVRAFGFPERAILEGEFGTKAEAGIHQGLALDGMEAIHEFLTEEFETQVLRPYLTLMGIDVAQVNLTAGPVSREGILWKRKIVEELVRGQPGLLNSSTLLAEVGIAQTA